MWEWEIKCQILIKIYVQAFSYGFIGCSCFIDIYICMTKIIP